jgi:acetyl esterase/lipase
MVVYFHGGGLYVGDVDSEDLTCRRICKGLRCTVYSCTYRKMPQFTAEDALYDALYAFKEIAGYKKGGKLVLMGSSSGGRR